MSDGRKKNGGARSGTGPKPTGKVELRPRVAAALGDKALVIAQAFGRSGHSAGVEIALAQYKLKTKKRLTNE